MTCKSSCQLPGQWVLAQLLGQEEEEEFHKLLPANKANRITCAIYGNHVQNLHQILYSKNLAYS